MTADIGDVGDPKLIRGIRCPAIDCLQSTRGNTELPVHSIVGHNNRGATLRAGLLFVTNLGPNARQTPSPVGADVLAQVTPIILHLAISIHLSAVIPSLLQQHGLTLILQRTGSHWLVQRPLGSPTLGAKTATAMCRSTWY